MNILFFNRSFYPDTEATGQFLTELCEDLTKLGHKITVICGKSYHVSNDEKGQLIKRESYKEIEILRASGTTFPKKSLFLRLVNLGTYFLNAFFAGFLIRQKPDIVIALTDPPLLGLHGIFFSKLFGAKFIYYCNDIYPDVGMITGRLRHPIYIFILKTANMLSFNLADKIIVIGEDMKKRVEKKGIDGKKIEIVHNWADTDALFPISVTGFREKYKLENNFLVMYSGNIGLTQNLNKLLEVAENSRNIKEIKFILIGEGADKDKLQSITSEKKLTNVQFLPYQPKEELNQSLNAADIHLITLEKNLAGVMVPSKVYGILACGKPFLAWVDEESEVATIAKKFNVGIVVEPGNVKEMTNTVNWAINNPAKLRQMGENSRKVAIDLFDRKISSNIFNKVLIQTML